MHQLYAQAHVRPVSKAANILTAKDIVRVCRGGISFRNGTVLRDISTKQLANGEVRLSYTRNDGKFFRYDCKIEQRIVRFRMIDEAGKGTGPGKWSGKGSTTTFKIYPKAIEFQDVYIDGSVRKEQIKI